MTKKWFLDVSLIPFSFFESFKSSSSSSISPTISSIISSRVIIPKNLLITIPITEKNRVKGYKKQTETKTTKKADVVKKPTTKKVNTKTYKRGCIIATNAAEASLTIKSLKFVVDIGFENTVSYLAPT